MQCDPALIRKYNINGPRYTSYPTALAMQHNFDPCHVQRAIALCSDDLSLYLHIPFCQQLCYYCGCNKIVTRHQHKADIYLQALEQEMLCYAARIAGKHIKQVHLGGGTPTFLTELQLTRLIVLIHKHFTLNADAELSIEIDPRSCSDDKLRFLHKLGFNRVSFGVQDLDEKVQIAINRVQDTDLIRRQMLLCREIGFASVNLDLIYGLPFQHPDSFAQTLDTIIQLNPDRISLFSYAHLPERFAAQRKIPDASLPDAETKLQLQTMGIEAFGKAGYQFIGMDHFAKPDDALAKAQQNGTLQRNFQGYTTAGQDTLIGLGVSSISQVSGVLWQNVKTLPEYYQMVAQLQLPIERGFCLNDDDKIRAALISQLICHFKLDTSAFCQQWGITAFWHYFADALTLLQPFMEDGLVEIYAERIKVTGSGRLWVRSICACFDAYLNQGQQRYSKVV
ncbi:oxygen-independent coproporphyrinogen III oxidase [Rheinheimera baltica]|uniref:oxygen-independent coproporphyrinogen III oxidase n=1 Tax=Rheinheimera baltica TaxID=67576 RepID=UPI00273D0CA6|nr:oxygen-independent coproporphyrinogen III oxidase [Rheinheimera baltica]MDP5141488.1 oxygen-independent coproporphyrinogen III oxidase [Rheinheimera baltica]MDP5148725.1 oxygen-independent coproporphyrinogen III oxidase [Rheinheimera baltica]MDP5191019.1 oxygen-independent coproporphyrinogen III oxidase [Rheinheimera baltica]